VQGSALDMSTASGAVKGRRVQTVKANPNGPMARSPSGPCAFPVAKFPYPAGAERAASSSATTDPVDLPGPAIASVPHPDAAGGEAKDVGLIPVPAMIQAMIQAPDAGGGEGATEPFPGTHGPGALRVATWNIAAVNNNPFEYWVTHDSESYDKLMQGVERFLEEPGDLDVTVEEIFTHQCFQELEELMINEKWAGVDRVRTLWLEDYSRRKIVSGFMKDKQLGKKRLASMPDRITNTIAIKSTMTGDPTPSKACRPTVINNFQGDLGSVALWWELWKQFMFGDELYVQTKKGAEKKRPCAMLEKIPRAKYPDLTEEEEDISIPLQTLCQAIFDSIIVHMMNTVSPDGEWQHLKQELFERLVRTKTQRCVEILSKSYASFDVVFLQEVSLNFVTTLRKSDFARDRTIVVPDKMDSKRDQNSVIVFRNGIFEPGTATEITDSVMAFLRKGDEPSKVGDGDVLGLEVKDSQGNDFMLVSYHGDSNGLGTVPAMKAVTSWWTECAPEHRVIIGLDANVSKCPKPGHLDIATFVEAYRQSGLSSCAGNDPAELGRTAVTTFNCRTYLQTQLNKAVKSNERYDKGDRNPKDLILFRESQYDTLQWLKDNTGQCTFNPDIPFPTLRFPSDHGIVAALLRDR